MVGGGACWGRPPPLTSPPTRKDAGFLPPNHRRFLEVYQGRDASAGTSSSLLPFFVASVSPPPPCGRWFCPSRKLSYRRKRLWVFASPILLCFSRRDVVQSLSFSWEMTLGVDTVLSCLGLFVPYFLPKRFIWGDWEHSGRTTGRIKEAGKIEQKYFILICHERKWWKVTINQRYCYTAFICIWSFVWKIVSIKQDLFHLWKWQCHTSITNILLIWGN